MSEELTPYELPDERIREAWRRLVSDYLICEPLEPAFAARLLGEGIKIFAELGSGDAPVSRLLAERSVRCVSFDLNPPDSPFRPLVQGDLRHLPFTLGSFDGVSAVNCLYFLADPSEAILEARQALRCGGLFLASTPSRYHDPELAEVVPDWGSPSPFDAEEAVALVSTLFDEVEEEWWEEPAYLLRDRAAVVDYMVAFRYPEPEQLANLVDPPLTITKSGVNVWARCSP